MNMKEYDAMQNRIHKYDEVQSKIDRIENMQTALKREGKTFQLTINGVSRKVPKGGPLEMNIAMGLGLEMEALKKELEEV